MDNSAEFDQMAHQYEQLLKSDLGYFGKELSVYADYKVKLASKLFSSNPKSIIEFGCGIGRNFTYFRKYFPNTALSGCDISNESIKLASQQFPDSCFFLSETYEGFLANAEEYDYCVIACVLHHIPPAEWGAWLSTIRKRLKPRGKILIFEHNLYNPLINYTLKRSVIDRSASFLTKRMLRNLLMSVGYTVDVSGYSLLFLWRNRFFETLEWWLKFAPLGAQYFVLATV